MICFGQQTGQHLVLRNLDLVCFSAALPVLWRRDGIAWVTYTWTPSRLLGSGRPVEVPAAGHCCSNPTGPGGPISWVRWWILCLGVVFGVLSSAENAVPSSLSHFPGGKSYSFFKTKLRCHVLWSRFLKTFPTTTSRRKFWLQESSLVSRVFRDPQWTPETG